MSTGIVWFSVDDYGLEGLHNVTPCDGEVAALRLAVENSHTSGGSTHVVAVPYGTSVSDALKAQRAKEQQS